MKKIAETLRHIIDQWIRKINTDLIGIILSVDKEHWMVDVELKHPIRGERVVLKNVPLMYPSFNGCRIIITPAVGDNVLLSCTKHDLHRQIRDNKPITAYIDAGTVFNIGNAITTTALTMDDEPKEPLADGEMWFQHNTGAGIRIDRDGNVVVTGKTIRFKKLVSS